jgi:hypothetical protein
MISVIDTEKFYCFLQTLQAGVVLSSNSYGNFLCILEFTIHSYIALLCSLKKEVAVY